MANNIADETAHLLVNEWGLQLPDYITEDDLLKALAARIVQLIDRGDESFFQLMYRLDVSEKKLNAVLQDVDSPHKIARLVYDRQLQKIQSRRENRIKNETDDPDLKW